MTAGSFQWPERLQMLCFRITFESRLAVVHSCMHGPFGTFQSRYFCAAFLLYIISLHCMDRGIA